MAKLILGSCEKASTDAFAREGSFSSTQLELILDVLQKISLAKDLETIMFIVRRAARKLSGADGATFVLRDGQQCFYADEDAISPLWKGKRIVKYPSISVDFINHTIVC
ncbi:sensor histidine kinase [Legionella birminghamensis]|uniref:Sensor histidine kinase n=1 Tax=Legionella birminghamensis TaxID=28083 RepID=A0A378ILT2_9GAMM|nr:hypothetical protein [Legionella birminghamensis]KTC75307.1 sensor histidine kinase [Legionella birminghamensis]STX33074.1 sensor histidine kinase [Legionella birminghamensis]